MFDTSVHVNGTTNILLWKGAVIIGKWRIIKDPNKSDMTFEYGNRDVELPPDAIITVTRMEGMSTWRTFINNLLSLAIIHQMSKKRGLLYAEISGKSQESGGNTLSIWAPKDMVPFRDSGSHKVSMKYFRWVFGGGAQSYFLTWKLEGHIPTYEEARDIVRDHGKHFDSNKLVRNATRPTWPKQSDLKGQHRRNLEG